MTATEPARGARLRGSDIVAVLAAQGVVIAALWIAHGGPDQLGEGPAGILTAIGQVTALYGTYLALIQLVLMSRSPWLDETFGMDGLAVAHRWLGFATVWLLLGHGIATTIGYALGDRGERRPGVPDAHHDVPVRPDGHRQRRAVRPRGDHVDQGGPAEAGVRDLVRAPPLRVPRGRARVPAPALRRRGLHARPAGRDLLDPALHRDRGPHPGLPHRAADPDVHPAPAPRGQRRPGRPGRGQPVSHRARARPPVGPRRPVLPVAVPDARRLVALAPLLDLRGTERGVAAHHRQGPRRRLR